MIEDDETPPTTIERLEQRDEVERLDENRAVVRTDGNAVDADVSGDITLAVELDGADGTVTGEFAGDSHKDVLEQFLMWYARHGTSADVQKMISGAFSGESGLDKS